MGKKVFNERWLGVTPIRYKTVRVTAAEIIAMFTTPKELIAAPGAGKYLEFVSAVLFLDAGTAFTGGGAAVIEQAGNTDISGTIAAASLVNSATDACVLLTSIASAGRVLVVNAGIDLTNAAQVHAAGTGNLTVHVAYRIHDFN